MNLSTVMALCSFACGVVLAANLITVGPVFISILAAVSVIFFARLS